MKRIIRRIFICAVIALSCWLGSVAFAGQVLHNSLIRIHIVAASDSVRDQELKLGVRDSVLKTLKENMKQCSDVKQAKIYLESRLPQLQQAVTQILRQAGCQDSVRISLDREKFGMLSCEMGMLPSGIYETLRITIGQGMGENWWCVLFPQNQTEKVAAAFSPEQKTEIRFAVLELLGKLENLFCTG